MSKCMPGWYVADRSTLVCYRGPYSTRDTANAVREEMERSSRWGGCDLWVIDRRESEKMWSEAYRCGCISPEVRTKKELPGYCPKHGENRWELFRSDKITPQQSDLSFPADVCRGCGRKELHKMCPAHGTPIYCDPSHPEWGKASDERLRELKQQPDLDTATRPCTCIGTCRGAEGLNEGWHCVLERAAVEQTDMEPPDLRGPAIIVSGSLLNGYKFTGPFKSIDDAVRWHEKSLAGAVGIPVTIALLEQP